MRIPEKKTPGLSLTTEAPGVRENPALMAAPGGMLKEAGDAFHAIGEKFEQMRDQAESTKAETELIKKYNQIHMQKAQDQDPFKAMDSLDSDLKSAVDDVSSSITTASARDIFKQKASVEMARKGVAIHNMLAQKQINASQLATFDYVDAKTDEFYKSADPAERNLIKNQISDKVRDAIKSGYFHAGAGMNYLNVHLGKLRTGQVISDMSVDPESTLRELHKGKDGMYPDLKPSEREDLTNKTENKIKRDRKANDQRIKDTWSNNEHAVWQEEWLPGKLNESRVEELLLTNKISPNFAKSMMKNLGNPTTINAETDNQTYQDITKFMMNPQNKTDAMRIKLMDANSAGKLSKIDLQKLYNMHIIPNKENDFTTLTDLVGKENMNKDLIKARMNHISNAISIFSKYAASFSGADVISKSADMLHRFVDKMQNKVPTQEIPKVANDVVKEQRLMDNPEMAIYPEDGTTIQDDNGIQAKAYPDGDLEDNNARDTSY